MRPSDFFSHPHPAAAVHHHVLDQVRSVAHRTPRHSIRPADGDEPTVWRGSVRGERDRVHTGERALASSLLGLCLSRLVSPRPHLRSIRCCFCLRLRSCGVAVGVNRGRGPVASVPRGHITATRRARGGTRGGSSPGCSADPIRSPIRPRALEKEGAARRDLWWPHTSRRPRLFKPPSVLVVLLAHFTGPAIRRSRSRMHV